jgi:hypothetical protein
MSRKDAEEIIAIIREEAQKIDPDITITPVGGYRYLLKCVSNQRELY